ncbi:MAG: hypothetical protein ABSG86_27005 [Thermoguttaceae bacterium]|jgi:hypothetical protein
MRWIGWLTVAAAVAVLVFSAARLSSATDPPKQPAKTQQPAAKAQPAPRSSTSATRQATTIQKQNPQTKGGAAAGWDTPATTKGSVKGNTSQTTAQAQAKLASQQTATQQKGVAQRYPATGKPVPPPAAQPAKSPPATGVKGFFSKLFGK